MSQNPANQINVVGTQVIPNTTTYQGIINNQYITGITTVSWNARSGGTSEVVFRGIPSQIISLAQLARVGGYEYKISGGHTWTLVVTFPFDVILDFATGESNPLFTWELINIPFEKDILELGDRPFNSGLSVTSARKIEWALNDTQGNILPYEISDAGTIDAVNAQLIYTLKRIGVHGKQTVLPTIRKTMIVSNFFSPVSPITFPAYDYNIFTTAKFLQIYNSDPNILNQIPTSMYNALPTSLVVSQWNPNNNVSLVTVPGGSYGDWNMDDKGIVTFVGWLQFPPEYQMVTINKIQITQNWSFNQWSAGPYGLYKVLFDGDNTTNTNSPDPNLVLKLY